MACVDARPAPAVPLLVLVSIPERFSRLSRPRSREIPAARRAGTQTISCSKPVADPDARRVSLYADV